LQWLFNAQASERVSVMRMNGLVRDKGNSGITEYIPTDEKTGARFAVLRPAADAGASCCMIGRSPRSNRCRIADQWKRA
jgi:hypothetical protein